VGNPAVVLPVVLAWLAVAGVLAAAVAFGQTARSAPRRRRRRTARRVGLFLSLSGPWLAVLGAVLGGWLTGAWVPAAATAACGIVVTAVLGWVLDPH
jgi:uncharacterized membrane protein YfcA